MQLTSLSLAISRIMGGGGAWSPLSLFAAGEQGAWYQPSDLSTLYQDAAGTTPVTGVAQPVGLMLDKSQGLALGSELVSTANTPSAWIPYGSNTVTQNGNNVAITSVNDSRGALLIFSSAGGLSSDMISGVTYIITFKVSVSSGTSNINFSNLTNIPSLSGAITTTPKTITVISSRTAFAPEMTFSGALGKTITIGEISVKSLAGNHAFQATTTPAKRPILSARVNLLTKTEQFDDAVWGLYGSSGKAPTRASTTGTLPNGSTGAITRVTFPAVVSNEWSFVGQSSGIQLSGYQVYANMYARVTSGTATIYLNIEDSISAPSSSNFIAGSAQTLTTTWSKISLTGTRINPTGNGSLLIGFDTRANAGQLNAGSITVELWGADLRPANIGNNIPAYQRVNTATDYDTTGFPYYLKADGVYTSMSTNSINFSATDKMTVVSGVRKLSDAAQGVVSELSATSASNNGSFTLSAPGGAATNYTWLSKGTTADTVTATPYTAPISGVLTGLASISGPSNALRVNGTATSDTNTQGTGNYGNYPLYLFARTNSSLFLNGYFYGAIIRGATTSGTDLTNAESYMNTQSGGLY